MNNTRLVQIYASRPGSSVIVIFGSMDGGIFEEEQRARYYPDDELKMAKEIFQWLGNGLVTAW